jgi:hypothetical protein
MSNWRTHPADTALIRALDRELPLARRMALDRHLMVCQVCRSRLEAFDDAAREATRACRDGAGDDSATTSALRQRLQQQMAELGPQWDRSLLFRFRRAAGSATTLARVGISVAFLVLVVRLIQPRVNSALSSALPPESLPKSQFTPGATSHESAAALCSGTLPTRRVVSIAVRQQVLQRYRMEHVAPSEYEFDFLITPELGGVADARNLWPERYESGVWNARVKDDLERLLPRLVCDGTVDLGVAQREIADNWIDAYKKYFKTGRPAARQAGLVENDDDEILFEPVPAARATRPAFVAFMRPSVSFSAAFTTKEFFTARSRRVAW